MNKPCKHKFTGGPRGRGGGIKVVWLFIWYLLRMVDGAGSSCECAWEQKKKKKETMV